jgi:hypothetical protein
MNQQEHKLFGAGIIIATGVSMLFALIIIKIMLFNIRSDTTFLLDLGMLVGGLAIVAVGSAMTFYYNMKTVDGK